jgi:hypothetical protein
MMVMPACYGNSHMNELHYQTLGDKLKGNFDAQHRKYGGNSALSNISEFQTVRKVKRNTKY